MTEVNHKDFTPDGYHSLINSLLNQGYRIADYQTIRPSEPDLILRHDVDMSINAAVALARIEAQLSVKSTYFVLLRSELYNPFSIHFQYGVREILSLGHQLGLHFDPTHYDLTKGVLDGAADHECGILESIAATKISTISFHRPPKGLIPYSGRLAGRLQTYAPAFFDEIGYCSDSRGEWRYGHPKEQAAIAAGTALQLLTHPIWWCSDTPTPEAKLEEFVADSNQQRRTALAENCEPYRSLLAKRGETGNRYTGNTR